MNLTTKYMGLELKNPVIVGSSGLTRTVNDIKKIEEKGAGAVVLKSIFEEQIRFESEKLMNQKDSSLMKPMQKGFDDLMGKRSYDYAEALEYISNFAREHTLKEYLDFVEDSKKSVKIPVIASIHCISAYDWHYFAKRIEDAGADALELNVYVLPSDLYRTSEENENIYSEIVSKVKKYVNIPVALKIGFYFSSLANAVIKLSESGIAALVLFNRPFSPDIDIHTFEITSGNIFSTPSEYSHTLRWVAILSGRLGCDLAAATGIHNAEAAIKQLLAGATTVQITSALYKNGFDQITKIVEGIKDWMEPHNFKSIDDFRGKLSQKNVENPAVFERVQFMKLYSNIE
jgi:dihydroorotate dehydrogenase (fumarate)